MHLHTGRGKNQDKVKGRFLSAGGRCDGYLKCFSYALGGSPFSSPFYFVRCVSSRLNNHLEDLSSSYRQLQDMIELSFQNEQTQVCTVSDCLNPGKKAPFTMAGLLTLHTAVSYGNYRIALDQLMTCQKALNVLNNAFPKRHLYEMVRAILLCLRLEHLQKLLSLDIPVYQPDKYLYTQLSDCVTTCCRLIGDEKKAEADSFSRDLLEYIDTNYMDNDLCMTALENRFKCSSSTIRKAFKKVADITVTSYIKQKRMACANELLAQNQKSITQIALECGFSNTNSFYKAYRRVYGHAPTTCR